MLNSCCSLASSSSGVISDLGFVSADDEAMMDEDRSNEVKTLESDFARVAARSSENVFGWFSEKEETGFGDFQGVHEQIVKLTFA